MRIAHQVVLNLSRWFPLPFALILASAMKGLLPLTVARHWLGRAVARNVWPRGRPWCSRVVRLRNGMQIEVDPVEFIGSQIVDHGYYEPATAHLVERLLRPGMVFIDVGANIGQYTLVASGSVGMSGRVHAFEPHPAMHDVLGRNVRR